MAAACEKLGNTVTIEACPVAVVMRSTIQERIPAWDPRLVWARIERPCYL